MGKKNIQSYLLMSSDLKGHIEDPPIISRTTIRKPITNSIC